MHRISDCLWYRPHLFISDREFDMAGRKAGKKKGAGVAGPREFALNQWTVDTKGGLIIYGESRKDKRLERVALLAPVGVSSDKQIIGNELSGHKVVFEFLDRSKKRMALDMFVETSATAPVIAELVTKTKADTSNISKSENELMKSSIRYLIYFKLICPRLCIDVIFDVTTILIFVSNLDVCIESLLGKLRAIYAKNEESSSEEEEASSKPKKKKRKGQKEKKVFLD